MIEVSPLFYFSFFFNIYLHKPHLKDEEKKEEEEEEEC